MPAMLDDPNAAPIYRSSGVEPFPDPSDSNPPLPNGIAPRQVTLRDRITTATIIPFSSPKNIPPSLLAYLSDQLNKEIELGDTYPMTDTMPTEKFASYWFQNFGAIMLLGNIAGAEDLVEGIDYTKQCLGSFYIKPNYPGRSSHVCNAGFLVTDAARARGVGRLMGESYIDWAPKLGYNYSIFNLVYETNVASCKIWDALGFKRVGRVKGAGNLRSYPNQLVDAIIFGRDLGSDGEDFVSEERFDKIKFYLKFGKYPNGSDRAEKSRLRSAATHYKLLDGEKLMLKGKEVISDGQIQYEIAKTVHNEEHAGINKCTALVSAKYHWVRIKETVSIVIRECTVCKEVAKEKAPPALKDNYVSTSRRRPTNQNLIQMRSEQPVRNVSGVDNSKHALAPSHLSEHHIPDHHQTLVHPVQIDHLQHLSDYNTMLLDPQIMEDIQHCPQPIAYNQTHNHNHNQSHSPESQSTAVINQQHNVTKERESPHQTNFHQPVPHDDDNNDQDLNMLSE